MLTYPGRAPTATTTTTTTAHPVVIPRFDRVQDVVGLLGVLRAVLPPQGGAVPGLGLAAKIVDGKAAKVKRFDYEP